MKLRPRLFAALAACQSRRDASVARLQAIHRARRVRRRFHRALDGCIYVDDDLVNFNEGVDVDAFLGGDVARAFEEEEALPSFTRQPRLQVGPGGDLVGAVDRPPSADVVLPDIFASRQPTPDRDILRSSSAPHSVVESVASVAEPRRRRRRHRPPPAPMPTSQIARDRQARARARKKATPAWASKPGG